VSVFVPTIAVNVGVPAVQVPPASVTVELESFLHDVIARPAIKTKQMILMFIKVLFMAIFIYLDL
jgi:hypothetical protein